MWCAARHCAFESHPLRQLRPLPSCSGLFYYLLCVVILCAIIESQWEKLFTVELKFFKLTEDDFQTVHIILAQDLLWISRFCFVRGKGCLT